ncbi:hypothetical protein LCGC14_1405750 [marine sediment metagenome]|uniref:Uncharacterized protein n=1 Tax=marine sediment metagenome TaxID=412755 RepID=A0A0F9MB53_9ZZZZ
MVLFRRWLCDNHAQTVLCAAKWIRQHGHSSDRRRVQGNPRFSCRMVFFMDHSALLALGQGNMKTKQMRRIKRSIRQYAKEQRKQELSRLIKIQASEMKNENLNRICGD